MSSVCHLSCILTSKYAQIGMQSNVTYFNLRSLSTKLSIRQGMDGKWSAKVAWWMSVSPWLMSILRLSPGDIYILRALGPDKVGQTRDVAHMNPKSRMFCQFLFLWHKSESKHLGSQKLGTHHVGVHAEREVGLVQWWIWIWQSCFKCATAQHTEDDLIWTKGLMPACVL